MIQLRGLGRDSIDEQPQEPGDLEKIRTLQVYMNRAISRLRTMDPKYNTLYEVGVSGTITQGMVNTLKVVAGATGAIANPSRMTIANVKTNVESHAYKLWQWLEATKPHAPPFDPQQPTTGGDWTPTTPTTNPGIPRPETPMPPEPPIPTMPDPPYVPAPMPAPTYSVNKIAFAALGLSILALGGALVAQRYRKRHANS